MNDFEPVNDWEYGHLMEILNANAQKSFVQRILKPQKYPTLDLGDGNYATHRMAWHQAGDKYYAFPTVLLNATGQLQDYGDKAWDHARQTNNFIQFDNPDEASWFSEKYKGAWGGQMNQPPK